MTDEHEEVVKLRIRVERGRQFFYLLSQKRADGKPKHGKLEMLGGHVETGELPFEALLRELREEETSGRLAEHVVARAPTSRTAKAGGATHHLFELTLSSEDCERLTADPDESLGFELVPATELDAGKHQERLTWRTQRVLETFGPGRI